MCDRVTLTPGWRFSNSGTEEQGPQTLHFLSLSSLFYQVSFWDHFSISAKSCAKLERFRDLRDMNDRSGPSFCLLTIFLSEALPIKRSTYFNSEISSRSFWVPGLHYRSAGCLITVKGSYVYFIFLYFFSSRNGESISWILLFALFDSSEIKSRLAQIRFGILCDILVCFWKYNKINKSPFENKILFLYIESLGFSKSYRKSGKNHVWIFKTAHLLPSRRCKNI